MPALRRPELLLSALTLLLSACGGGGGADPGGDIAAVPPPTSIPTSSGGTTGAGDAVSTIELSARMQAAEATAGHIDNACTAIRPFYWEIGDADGRTAGGSIGRTANGQAVGEATTMRYASATKWLYAAYVVERRGGTLQAWDERMLSMRSGYTHFSGCLIGQTVDACLAWQDNDQYEAADDGRFAYGGAHMQKHASLLGLGAMDAAALASTLSGALGIDIGMRQAQPAGGATGTPAAYARFLRRVVGGQLAIGARLGAGAVCASQTGCTGDPSTPAPAQEVWHYAMGHWVEDDPSLGDGAFSSGGAFGFYPWVDADRQGYGMVARDAGQARDNEGDGPGVASARCGRLIRRAWATGVAQ
jgi:hypothetical protein